MEFETSTNRYRERDVSDPTLWAIDRDRKELTASRRMVGVAASVHHTAADILKYEAAYRGVPVSTLLGKILETVAKDDLFAAIIDQ